MIKYIVKEIELPILSAKHRIGSVCKNIYEGGTTTMCGIQYSSYFSIVTYFCGRGIFLK